MGYVPNLPLLHLTFEGDLAELWVDVREGDLGLYDRISEVTAGMNPEAFEQGGVPDAGTTKALVALATELCPLIVAWSVEDASGAPVPVGEGAWRALGTRVQTAVLLGWLSGVMVAVDVLVQGAVPKSEG